MFITLHASGQALDTTIVGTKSIGKDIVVYLSNHLEDAEVKTWNKSEVRIEYRVSLLANSKEEATAFYRILKSSISSQLNETGSKLNVSFPFRNYSRNNNKVEVKFTSGTEKYVLKELKTSLVVYMPAVNALEAHCNFNRLTVGDLLASASIDISSVEFRMGNCRELALKANFSKNMIIGEVEKAQMEINSSAFNMESVKTSLTLKSSFSSCVVGKIGTEAILDLQSSSFESGDVAELDLKGSFIRNFKLNQVNTARIAVNSSELNIEKIGILEVPEISFSNLNIKTADDIKVNSSSSTTFAIENVKSLESNRCSFTNFSIGNLKDRFTTNGNSGSVNIKNALAGFSEINITGSFVTTHIKAAPESSLTIHADLTFPNYTFDNVTIQNREKDMSHEVLTGTKGNTGQAKSQIHLNCQSCKITVK
jgi:hypothetical protein